MDTLENKGSGYALCNPNEAAAANLTYALKLLDGTLVAAKDDTLAASSQKAEFVSQTFDQVDFTDFQGVLLITSDVPVSVVTLRTRGTNYTSFPAVPQVGEDDEDDDLLFARIADGEIGGLTYETSFILLNNSEVAVSATVELFSVEGSELMLSVGSTVGSSFTVEVPAGGGTVLTTDGNTVPGVVGWARVTVNNPLGGGAAFTMTNSNTGAFASEVGVPASPLSVRPEIFV